MTRGKVRIVSHRRRRQGRTDYRQRLALIKSGRPRFIVRKSVNSMTCQIVEHSPGGDRSLVSVSSRNLSSFGWSGPGGNLPGAYMTGFLCGTLAREKGVRSAVLDMGLQASTKGSRIYSALKGCLDAGIDIPHSPEILPPMERIRGLHIEEHARSGGRKSEVSNIFDGVKETIASGRKTPASKTPSKKPAKKTVSKKPASRKTPSKKPSK
jgi:large subunit ribosomal protein L18